jgi:hypothetical protein
MEDYKNEKTCCCCIIWQFDNFYKKSLTSIDVIVTNKRAHECSSAVLDLGYSDHMVQY